MSAFLVHRLWFFAGLLALITACAPSVSIGPAGTDGGGEPSNAGDAGDGGQVSHQVCRLDDCSDPGAEYGFGCFLSPSDAGQICPEGWVLGGVEACQDPSFNCERACTHTTTCVPLGDYCDAGPSCGCLKDAGCWELDGIACDQQGLYACTLAP